MNVKKKYWKSMTDFPENINVNNDYLKKLKDKIITNKATPEEYKILDEQIYIFVGVKNFILDSFNEEGLSSYKEYVTERRRLSGTINNLEGALVGKMLGAIRAIMK